MKHIVFIFSLLLASTMALAQQSDADAAQLRQQIAKIRSSTNWNDPAEVKKANEQIQKLSKQLNSGKQTISIDDLNLNYDQKVAAKNVDFEVKSAVTQENIVAIADRFFKRSYKQLDPISKTKFDQDYKDAAKEKFSLNAIRKLTNTGGVLLTFGNDHLIACVYLTAAVKAFPTDTLSMNNFGGYLRMIDSTSLSVPVLLYANKLFSKSPIILTQLGNSYFELNDYAKAESYLKEALKVNPEFGQAHTSLCDLYIKQNRLKDAILELFAGVKGMGCSYNQASNNYSYLQQQSENSGSQNNQMSKQDFWDEARKQLDPPEALAPLAADDALVKMPNFPDCKKVEDWLEGGGLNSAIQSYQGFHAYQISFVNEHLAIRQQKPDLPPNAVLRDYPNERLAIDCITEMFFATAKQDEQKYREKVDKITQSVNDAKELYLQKLLAYTKQGEECYKGCSDQWCRDECSRVFCNNECPNANNFNDFLRRSYSDWFSEFYKLVNSQKKILDDLYGFSNPWLAKISSPYLSRMYAYEIKSAALSIVGNCFAAYPQTFQALSHNNCGTDCSIYANPAPHNPDEVNKKAPEGNQCPNIGKLKIPLLMCELGLDCESIEFGCAAGVAGSLKRNFVKKTTTGFLGVGVKGDAGFIGAGAKAGFEVTVTDNNEIKDVGAKVDLSVSVGVGVAKASLTGTGSYTVMTGLSTKAGLSGSPKF